MFKVKRMLSLMLSALMAGLIFNAAALAAPNFYGSVVYKNLKGPAKAAYIEEKTAAIFQAGAYGPQPPYTVCDGWTRELATFDGVPVEKYKPLKKGKDRVVFFCHGGGYVLGLTNSYRDWGINHAALAGNAVLYTFDYRLAPRYKYPAALEDAVKVYKGMLQEGVDPEKVIMIGDSAGGNLALALAMYLRDNKLPLPKVLILISPWLDLGTTLPSRKLALASDKILGSINKRMVGQVTQEAAYAKGCDLFDPYVSPLYGSFEGLPEMLLTAGSDELLLDDTLLAGERAELAGVRVERTVYAGMSHDWTLTLPELPDTKAMFKEIKKFINKKMD